jgi:hypothetical protein
MLSGLGMFTVKCVAKLKQLNIFFFECYLAHLTVRQGLEDQHWIIDITGSMSPAAIAEFLEL